MIIKSNRANKSWLIRDLYSMDDVDALIRKAPDGLYNKIAYLKTFVEVEEIETIEIKIPERERKQYASSYDMPRMVFNEVPLVMDPEINRVIRDEQLHRLQERLRE